MREMTELRAFMVTYMGRDLSPREAELVEFAKNGGRLMALGHARAQGNAMFRRAYKEWLNQ